MAVAAARLRFAASTQVRTSARFLCLLIDMISVAARAASARRTHAATGQRQVGILHHVAEPVGQAGFREGLAGGGHEETSCCRVSDQTIPDTDCMGSMTSFTYPNPAPGRTVRFKTTDTS